MCERETAGGRRSGRECTTKDKNPTTRCGEKHHQFCFLHCIFYILKILHIFVVTFISCSLTGHIYILYIYYIYIIYIWKLLYSKSHLSFLIYHIYIYIRFLSLSIVLLLISSLFFNDISYITITIYKHIRLYMYTINFMNGISTLHATKT